MKRFLQHNAPPRQRKESHRPQASAVSLLGGFSSLALEDSPPVRTITEQQGKGGWSAGVNQQSAKRKGTNRIQGEDCLASQRKRDPFSSRVCSCL